MASMNIQNFERQADGSLSALGSVTTWRDCGGYADANEAAREIRKRFKHRNPRPITNGIELDGDAGTVQRIWFT